MNFVENEKPNRATAVRNTLAAVTRPVPNRFTMRSDKRLDRMVPPEMIMETMPTEESGTPKAGCIAGQPEPSSESGRPRLMKAR